MKLTRFPGNPILSPTSNWWEIQATFNPAAAIFNNQIVLLYRAIGGDNISRFGVALSNDGQKFQRFDSAILEGDLENPYERLGIEDPRITKIEDTYYIVYTAVSVYEAESKSNDLPPSRLRPAPWRTRLSLISTKDFKNFERKGVLLDRGTKDGVLFPEKINEKFVLMHRIYPNVYLSYSDDMVKWEAEKTVLSPRENFWDSERVGNGGVPIKTPYGWLIFYHGVDNDHTYRLGVVCLDLNNPEKVVYRGKQSIFEPETDYEKVGLTPNVVFTCATLEIGDNFFVYYGAADKYVGLAKINKEELLSEIKSGIQNL